MFLRQGQSLLVVMENRMKAGYSPLPTDLESAQSTFGLASRRSTLLQDVELLLNLGKSGVTQSLQLGESLLLIERNSIRGLRYSQRPGCSLEAKEHEICGTHVGWTGSQQRR